MIAGYLEVLVTLYLFLLVLSDGQMAVISNGFPAIVFYKNIFIFFAVDKDLLITLLVLKSEFIKLTKKLKLTIASS